MGTSLIPLDFGTVIHQNISNYLPIGTL